MQFVWLLVARREMLFSKLQHRNVRVSLQKGQAAERVYVFMGNTDDPSRLPF